jgi:hypothetical protein
MTALATLTGEREKRFAIQNYEKAVELSPSGRDLERSRAPVVHRCAFCLTSVVGVVYDALHNGGQR